MPDNSLPTLNEVADNLVRRNLIDRVLTYQNDLVIEQIEKNLGLTRPRAELLFSDTKKFLYLCGIREGEHLAPPEMVDKGWHEFILCTKAYESFCLDHFGRFIHHRPFGKDDMQKKNSALGNTVLWATNTFGELSINWQVGRNVVQCRAGCSRDCNSNDGCAPDVPCDSNPGDN